MATKAALKKSRKNYFKQRRVGAPSLKDHLNLRQLRQLVLSGMNDHKIAEFYGISRSAFIKWKARDLELLHKVDVWKEQADERVEKSLFHRAIGYDHPEDRVFCEKGKVTVVPMMKHLPPDVGAGQFWLTNRRANKWKTKVEHELSGDVNLCYGHRKPQEVKKNE